MWKVRVTVRVGVRGFGEGEGGGEGADSLVEEPTRSRVVQPIESRFGGGAVAEGREESRRPAETAAQLLELDCGDGAEKQVEGAKQEHGAPADDLSLPGKGHMGPRAGEHEMGVRWGPGLASVRWGSDGGQGW